MILKFRAWHHGAGDPRYQAHMNYSDQVALPIFFKNVENEGMAVEEMQFTGLQDKNANDIYTDDIVQDKNNVCMLITWDDRQLFYAIDGKMLGYYDSCDLEIIGNIHQHSHLLDKGE